MDAHRRPNPVVIIPAYNEANAIAALVRRVRQHGLPVIVVDDGSTDGTAARLEGLHVTLLRHDQNRGKGASVLTGARWALHRGYTQIITMDGDGQHLPEDVLRLLEEAERYPQCIIIGARLIHRAGAPRVRRFANRFADFWVSWAAGQPIVDSQSGLRLYPAEVFAGAAPSRQEAKGFSFDGAILITAAAHGWQTHALAVESIYRHGGRASHYRPVIDTLTIVRMVARQLLRRGLYPKGLWRVLTRRRPLYMAPCPPGEREEMAPHSALR